LRCPPPWSAILLLSLASLLEAGAPRGVEVVASELTEARAALPRAQARIEKALEELEAAQAELQESVGLYSQKFDAAFEAYRAADARARELATAAGNARSGLSLRIDAIRERVRQDREASRPWP